VNKSDRNSEALRRLGIQLRMARKSAGLTQGQVCTAMGMKGVISRAYLHRLEKGELRNVGFMTVVGYLQACKEPISKFVLELAQSGAFGEVDAQCVMGFTSQDSPGSSLKLR
jgi:transcriptional regulator with XRE-family HTH domain